MDKIKKLLIIGIIGIILLFPNLMLSLLRVLEIYEFNLVTSLGILLFSVIGGIITVVSTILLNEERRKEKEKSMNSFRN